MIKQRFAGLLVAVFMAFLPIIVNAQFSNEVKLQGSDSNYSDQFGYSLSIDGDTLIAGAPGHDASNDDNAGSAYILVRDPSTGAWTEQQELLGTATSEFGQAVAVSGDMAIVGTGWGSGFSNYSSGVYAFSRDSTTGIWTESQRIDATDTGGIRLDNFGISVDIDGNTAIMGAHYDDDNGYQAGAAYIFVRDASSGLWIKQAKLLASDGAANDLFGNAVSIDGDTAVVGAPKDSVGISRSGSVYVFVRDSTTGAWTEQQKLAASTLRNNDKFGKSVSISGNRLIAGARGADDKGDNAGAATIYERDPSTNIWLEQPQLLANDGSKNDFFGNSVAINGDTAIIGAYGDGPVFNATGAAYIFVRSPSTGAWTQQSKILASDGVGTNAFGTAVVIDGSTVIVRSDSGFKGSIYIYTSIPQPDISVTDSVAPSTNLQIGFGNITEMTSSDQTVTIANDGSLNLVLGTIAASDTLATPFSIQSDTCSTVTLTPGSNCSIGVRFSPASIGTFSDSFDIPSNDTDENPVTFYVNGSGIGVPAPDITVTDAVAPVGDLQIPFGSVTEMANADQIITVTNDGNANLVIGNVAMANALAAPFTVVNDNCSSQTLAPTANCTFTARFSPTATGAFSDSFDIPSNDSDESSVIMNVSGTGTPVPVPDITVTDAIAPASDQQIPFADLTLGGSSDQTVTVANDGNADLVIGTIAQANALAAPFSVINDNCSGQTVSATASCTFDVRFAPMAVGSSSDSFDIPSNDSDESSVTINVSGTGLVGPNNPPSSPSLVSPANAQAGLSTTVTLKWTPATDPDGDTLSYDVYSCTGADPANNCTAVNVAALQPDPDSRTYYAGLGLGGSMAILGITFVGGIRHRRQIMVILAALAVSVFLVSCGGGGGSGGAVGDSNKSYVATGLSPGTTYYWTVIAKDGNGGETASAIWSYQTR